MNPVLSADLNNTRHVRPAGFSKFLSAARKEFLEARRRRHDQHARWLIASILERMNDAVGHESGASWTNLMPLAVH